MTSKEYFLKAYLIKSHIGEGHFSVVKKAVHRFTRETVAIKMVNKSNLSLPECEQLSQEVAILKLVQHPSVIRLYESFEDAHNIYMVLEYGKCNLDQYIKKHCKDDPISEDTARIYFGQIVSAVSYFHRFRIVHRDLKPENILLCNQYKLCKIADFGLSRVSLDPTQDISAGTREYMAPETILSKGEIGEKSDIWGLGIILYMMVISEHPFHHRNPNEVVFKIIECIYDIPNRLSVDCQSLIRRILVKDPNKRATLEEIAVDPWLNVSKHNGHLGTGKNKLVTINREIHQVVIEKMVNNSMGTAHEINESLKEERFNQISACYYLLAESLIKKTLKLDFPIQVNIDKSKKNVGTEYLTLALLDLTSDVDINLYVKQSHIKPKASTLKHKPIHLDSFIKPALPQKSNLTKFYSNINLTDMNFEAENEPTLKDKPVFR
ncbi:SNF-related serine/threonine-protein kinase [Thelohanellus kitauei]|uniref:SNF-related serine/threonine-protein kinase n=1 Tax=Thelohanellus kitauei TaxID=669202 RepID=A0A0C2N0I4_THEKT|nr:SNF-related serine/threonine-protein kinase [Thelohanellus kitauei]